MHYPYVALTWTPGVPAQDVVADALIRGLSGASPRWQRRVLGPGTIVFDQPMRSGVGKAHVLCDGCGIIYGRLFRNGREQAVSPEALLSDPVFAKECIDTCGDYLVKNFWGCYVALLRDPKRGDWRVLRDCSGSIQCFYTNVRGVWVFFSDIQNIEAIASPFSVNWQYLSAFLSFPFLQVRETALRDVCEVLAGESIQSRDGHVSTRLAWNPVVVAESLGTADVSRAAAEIRDTAESCISAWASVHDSVLHSLSGGFDSAVVLACLMQAHHRPSIICVNRFASGAAEDERAFARLAARRVGLSVLEVPWDTGSAVFDDQILRVQHVSKPTVPYLIQILHAPAWRDISANHHCQAIWTGQGGDHLFGAFTTELGIVDSLRCRGLGRRFMTSLHDTARLTGRSLWHLLADLARFAFDEDSFRRAAQLEPNAQLMPPDAIPKGLTKYVLHPWYWESRGIVPGKRYQLLQLADVLNRQRPVLGLEESDEFHPLLAQPLIEACLRVPLDVLLLNGKTRGLARLAFENHVPPEILRREQKGHTSAHMMGLLRRSIPYLKEILLDGLLASKGLLSRSALMNILDPDLPIRSEMFFPLFASVAAEVWLRSWSGSLTTADRASDPAKCAPTASAISRYTDTPTSGERKVQVS